MRKLSILTLLVFLATAVILRAEIDADDPNRGDDAKIFEACMEREVARYEGVATGLSPDAQASLEAASVAYCNSVVTEQGY